MTDKEKFLTTVYLSLKRTTQTLDALQHDLAKYGYDFIAYGSIARAMGAVLEARCDVNKEREEPTK